jgi:NTE family protein
MDSPVVPHKGFLNTSVFQWHDAVVNADEPFPSLEIRTIYVKPVSTAVALYLDASGGSSLGFANSGVPLFSLGGVGRLSAYGRNELLANQYWLGRAGYLQKLTTLPPLLGGGLFLTGSYEIGKAYGIQGGPNLPMDGTVGIVIETAFGPLFTGASVGDSGHHRFLFRLGRFF